MKHAYISGPMTGLPGYNYSAFDDAAVRLRSQGGNTVLNPADNFGRRTDLPRWQYISKALEQINSLAKRQVMLPNDECYVVTLDGWEESSGARLEVEAAHQLGLDVYSLECVLSPHWESSCRIIPAPGAKFKDPHEDQVSVADGISTGLEHLALYKEKATRSSVLQEAERLTTGDRNNQYGPPGKDFNRAANALTALGFGREDVDGKCDVLNDHDVAIIMIVLKLSRLMWSPQKRDSWVDVAGYAGCGAEVAGAE